MPDQPIALTGTSLEDLKSQIIILMDELYQERVGGSMIGDVFSIGDDDILTMDLAATPGLEKSSGLKVKVKTTGGITLDSNGLSVKCKDATDLATDASGLYLVGLTKFAFVTIACPAGTNPVADAAADQLNLAVGSNKISITGTAASDTITFDVVQANVDHDALTNFVANEHINWTGATVALQTSSTVRADSGFVVGAAAGSGTDFTLLSAIQAGGVGPKGIQYKNQVITLTGGIITAVGAESGWNDI